ncbi:hypothetical protein [Methylobacterium sp. E-066]|uniref:hypothetical protein n=1 Tax=Methylobacterium sp. E-066 TaxID=2836584 RepID=UPI001FB9F8AA|nr:hypothetical protein [Methylobacterium sp. E-066]MCJ2138423.1 hypothetical protein [Methylobacterium sp. E-066]
MFALPPDEPDLGDLQPLAEAIEGLCAILDGDREVVIEGLAEILRRRIAFEATKRRIGSRLEAPNDPQA